MKLKEVILIIEEIAKNIQFGIPVNLVSAL